MHPDKSTPGRILIAGLGTAHGDDQAGWLFAEAFTQAAAAVDFLRPLIEIRRALIPLDLLDWFDSVDILHVCDACQQPGDRSAAANDCGVHRLQWVQRQFRHADGTAVDCESHLQLRTGSTHDYGLQEVLSLAAATGQLPATVVIWAVEGSRFAPGDAMTEGTADGVRKVVNRLLGELLQELPGHASTETDRASTPDHQPETN